MFVSSYSTFIQTNTTQKVAKDRVENSRIEPSSFNKILSKEIPATNIKSVQLPVDYISKSVVLNNKQELEKQQNKQIDSQKNSLSAFTGQNSLINAKSAYESNSKMFSLLKIPTTTLHQTPSLDSTLPAEPREMKELNMRHKMVNTYLANDNYYKVTA